AVPSRCAPVLMRGGLFSPQNCLSKQQLLSAIRQLQQLLKGQETRFAEGIRHMKSRLAALQNSVSRVASDAPPVSCPALSAPPDGRKFGSKYLVDHEVHFTCNPGFRLVGPSSVVCLPNGTWTGEQPRCRGTSECSSQPCQNGGTCVEGVGQHRCICPPGRTGSRCQHQAQTGEDLRHCHQTQRCQELSSAAFLSSDVNECELYGQEGRPRLCMHACVNTPGSYRCTCPSGYHTLTDGKTCEDVDECAGPQPVCPQGTTCINTGGGFQCVSPECPEGSHNVSYVKTSPLPWRGRRRWRWTLTCQNTLTAPSRPTMCPRSPSLCPPMTSKGAWGWGAGVEIWADSSSPRTQLWALTVTDVSPLYLAPALSPSLRRVTTKLKLPHPIFVLL
uniref:Fibulin-7 n=1 Tax=Marmota marmota marmota TaxID=9994 RepID=A0A8C5YQL0_MARMA